MPRKKIDPYAPLRPIVKQLGSLTHDELRDLVDMLVADRATQERDIPKRYGLPPVNPREGHPYILNGGWQYRDDPPRFTREARDEFQEAYAKIDALPFEAKLLIEDVALQLQHALKPVPERKQREGKPTADGDIQSKYITRKKWDDDLKQVVKVAYGPYLYYRVWVSGGDGDKRTRRHATRYIGQMGLALLHDRTEPHSAERAELTAKIIAAYKAGTLDALALELGVAEKSNGQLEPAETAPNTPPLFLPDYKPEKNRRQYHEPIDLTDVQRKVLATYAAGLNYGAYYQEGIQMRRIARWLAEKDLLREYTGHVNHREHRWALTEYGLEFVRQDQGLQALITPLLWRP